MKSAHIRPIVAARLVLFGLFGFPGLFGGASVWAVDYPLSVARGADFAALLRNPTEISFSVDGSPPSPATTATQGDLHAVYPVPLDVMRQVITDYNRYPDFSPRVSHSRAVQIGDDPPTWRQRLTLSFRVLFFGSDYDYYLTVMEPPLHGAGTAGADGMDRQFAMHYRMDRSLDGQLTDVAGSWYLRAVEIDAAETDGAQTDGVPHTYVRYFNSIHFAQDQFGLRLALRNLGARDLKNVMDAFYQEAERRMSQ